MGKSSSPEIPESYDGTQFLVRVQLPAGAWTAAQLYPDVSRVRVPGDFRPNPYFSDGTGAWWTLTSPIDYSVKAFVWMIRLEQLTRRSREATERYLHTALTILARWASGFGASLEPESSIPQALEKIDRVRSFLTVRDYEVRLLIVVHEGGRNRVDDWWRAFEGVGLEYGDGNLFWMFDDSADKSESVSGELFCAEPYSVPGYFHRGNIGQEIRFPDVALHFRARGVKDPIAVLRRMTQIAEQVARQLDASLTTMKGRPFDLANAEQELSRNLASRVELPRVP
ncbi:MAG TPA: cell division protein ZipA C-terminal FtsZ-binding domain-containing protein [Gemmata sp.]|nr:cell division protein ZipA C-terminal FtsZ-binding domain-containing protein [Gemmata sp.]